MPLNTTVNNTDDINVRSTSYSDSNEDLVIVNFAIMKGYIQASLAYRRYIFMSDAIFQDLHFL